MVKAVKVVWRIVNEIDYKFGLESIYFFFYFLGLKFYCHFYIWNALSLSKTLNSCDIFYQMNLSTKISWYFKEFLSLKDMQFICNT